MITVITDFTTINSYITRTFGKYQIILNDLNTLVDFPTPTSTKNKCEENKITV